MKINSSQNKASFRDPSGFIFVRDGQLLRQVNRTYQPHYQRLVASGLWTRLQDAGLMVVQREVDVALAPDKHALCVLQPEQLPFISYPYEWSFSQLKDAALLTLTIHRQALQHGMVLKDASAYNIQFHQGRPLLIDTLSFEIYDESCPWTAYRQFCQHFLAPLALMAHTDVRLSQLLRVYIDGIPLDLASRLLPRRTWMNLGLLSHIHLHARAQKAYGDRSIKEPGRAPKTNRVAHLGLIDSLESTIKGLRWKAAGTDWADYYDATNYTRQAFELKKQTVQDYLQRVQPEMVWDLGANTGVFSRLAAQLGYQTISADVDPGAVEKNYLLAREQKDGNLLPLVLDLTNPSPGLGWENCERDPWLERGPADVVLALALVHHLAISNNVSLEQLAAFFARAGRWLVVEFVPKEDSQTQRLLHSREDIFPNYTEAGFEAAFSNNFDIVKKDALEGSKRTLYLMHAR